MHLYTYGDCGVCYIKKLLVWNVSSVLPPCVLISIRGTLILIMWRHYLLLEHLLLFIFNVVLMSHIVLSEPESHCLKLVRASMSSEKPNEE